MWPEVSADLLTSQSTWEKRVWLVTRRGSSGDLSLRFISVVTRPGITMRYRSFFFFFLISECLLLHGDLRREDPLRKPLLLQQMIYSGDVCVNITPVQRAECDVVRLMQSWIHPRSPVAADIVFHSRPACWQRAWHPPSSCPPPRPLFHPLFFLYPPSLVPLHKHASPPPPFLPVISLSAAVISACLLCLGKKKKFENKKKNPLPVWWHHCCHSCSSQHVRDHEWKQLLRVFVYSNSPPISQYGSPAASRCTGSGRNNGFVQTWEQEHPHRHSLTHPQCHTTLPSLLSDAILHWHPHF